MNIQYFIVDEWKQNNEIYVILYIFHYTITFD